MAHRRTYTENSVLGLNWSFCALRDWKTMPKWLKFANDEVFQIWSFLCRLLCQFMSSSLWHVALTASQFPSISRWRFVYRSEHMFSFIPEPGKVSRSHIVQCPYLHVPRCLRSSYTTTDPIQESPNYKMCSTHHAQFQAIVRNIRATSVLWVLRARKLDYGPPILLLACLLLIDHQSVMARSIPQGLILRVCYGKNGDARIRWLDAPDEISVLSSPKSEKKYVLKIAGVHVFFG